MLAMTLTTFALIRHGQTDWNAQRRLQGSSDIPLNDVGRGQAQDAVAILSGYEWDAIVSSPLSRAAETADLIAAGLGLTVARRVPELTERDFEVWPRSKLWPRSSAASASSSSPTGLSSG
jgi:probable phosphoglycerate mutase